MSRQRFLAVWLPYLPTERIRRERRRCAPPDDQARPFVVVAREKNALRLVAVDPAAGALGLRSGMALADARAMHPELDVAEADPSADAATMSALAEACERYTPLVALAPPDGIVLDITGCAHLFEGEAKLAGDLLRRMRSAGFTVRIGLASNARAASAFARFGDRTITMPDDEIAALQPLPLAALGLAGPVLTMMARVGLRWIGDIRDMPRKPLAARFGKEVLDRLDAAFGRSRAPISPRRPVPGHMAERGFLTPITRQDDVLEAVASLAARLVEPLERDGHGARRLELALFRVDGAVRRIAVGASRPLREAGAMRDLFRHRLDGLADPLDAGFGYDLLRLSVLVAEPLEPAQASFSDTGYEADLACLVDRLGARLGLRRVQRLLPYDTHIPEFAMIAVPAAHSDARKAQTAWPAPARQTPIERPLRLLERPEPVEAVAEVPDGPPVRFRWRRATHVIARSEGPERIAPEWWRGEKEALTRDYFRVEDGDGRRFWLYREGLYGRETMRPRWFMHGLFA